MTKEDIIFEYLENEIFLPVINSSKASKQAKNIVNKSMMCLKQLPAQSMISYVLNTVRREDNNGEKAEKILSDEGFKTFKDIIKEFNNIFNDTFITSNLEE